MAARSDLAVRACFFDPKVTDVACEFFATEIWLMYGGAGGRGGSNQTSAGGCSGIVLSRTYWGSMSEPVGRGRFLMGGEVGGS